MVARKTLTRINIWLISISFSLLGLPILFGNRANLQYAFLGVAPYLAVLIFNAIYIHKNQLSAIINKKTLIIFGLLSIVWLIAILRGAFYKIDQLSFFTLGIGITWIILTATFLQALVISPIEMIDRIKRAALYAAGVYVLFNLTLHAIGVRAPDQLFLAKYPAQMASLLGIQTYRVVFPMASGFNNFGSLAGVVIASCPFLLREKTLTLFEKILIVLMIISSVISIFLTDSRGALIFSIGTLCLMFLPKMLFNPLRWVVLGTTLFLPFLLINPPSFLVEKMTILARPASEWQQQPDDDSTNCTPLASASAGFLTNRTAIWQTTMDAISFTNPRTYFGYGFRGQLISGVSKKYSCLFSSYENQIFISSHQIWLQTVMDIGIIGLILTLTTFVFLMLELERDQKFPLKGINAAYSAFLLYTVAIGTLESSVFPDAFEIFTLVFLLLAGFMFINMEGKVYDRTLTS